MPNRLFTAKGRDSRYSQFIENYEESYENWRYIPLSQAVGNELGIQSRQLKKALGENYEREIESFVMRYPERVIRTARPDYKSVGQNVRDAIDASKRSEKVFLLKRKPFRYVLYEWRANPIL